MFLLPDVHSGVPYAHVGDSIRPPSTASMQLQPLFGFVCHTTSPRHNFSPTVPGPLLPVQAYVPSLYPFSSHVALARDPIEMTSPVRTPYLSVLYIKQSCADLLSGTACTRLFAS